MKIFNVLLVLLGSFALKTGAVRRPKSNQIWKPVEAKDLLKEVGENKMKLVEESTFNETGDIQLCWITIMYLNYSTDVRESWNEYRVVIESAPEAKEDNSDDSSDSKEYRYYQHLNGKVPYKFEVIEQTAEYTLAKNETVTCERGNFLVKSYYEWTDKNKKKVVLTLSENEDEDFEADDKDVSTEAPETEEILNAIPPTPKMDVPSSYIAPDLNEMTGTTTTTTTTTEETTTKENITSDAVANGSKLPKRYYKFNAPKLGSAYDQLKGNSTQTNGAGESLPPLSPCSPILTQLLSGSGIIPGLCGLRKDDSVLLRGDIVVSRKFFDESNETEEIRPMYVIHEDTEIERLHEMID